MFRAITPLRMPIWRLSRTLDPSTPKTSANGQGISACPVPVHGQQMHGRQRCLPVLNWWKSSSTRLGTSKNRSTTTLSVPIALISGQHRLCLKLRQPRRNALDRIRNHGVSVQAHQSALDYQRTQAEIPAASEMGIHRELRGAVNTQAPTDRSTAAIIWANR